MKKKLACILLVTSCLLTACGSDEKVITGEVKNMDTNDIQKENDAEEEKQTQDSEKNGYMFVSQDVSIEIDGEAQPYIDELSDLVSVYESPSCAFGDLDKIYTYNGFEMDTYTLNGVEYVSAVVFKDDSVMTSEGAGIGNTVEEVKEIYGEPGSEEATILTYVKDDMKLCFLIKDGEVASVEYRTMILE